MFPTSALPSRALGNRSHGGAHLTVGSVCQLRQDYRVRPVQRPHWHNSDRVGFERGSRTGNDGPPWVWSSRADWFQAPLALLGRASPEAGRGERNRLEAEHKLTMAVKSLSLIAPSASNGLDTTTATGDLASSSKRPHRG